MLLRHDADSEEKVDTGVLPENSVHRDNLRAQRPGLCGAIDLDPSGYHAKEWRGRMWCCP